MFQESGISNPENQLEDEDDDCLEWECRSERDRVMTTGLAWNVSISTPPSSDGRRVCFDGWLRGDDEPMLVCPESVLACIFGRYDDKNWREKLPRADPLISRKQEDELRM